MGREARTTVDDGRAKAEARLHLDSEMLTVGLPFRLKLRLDSVAECAAEGNGLRIRTGDSSLSIALPAKEAAAWVKAVLHPPSLATKLGLKAGMGVALLGSVPSEIATLVPNAEQFQRRPRRLGAALSFVAVVSSTDEDDLAALKAAMAPGAAVWLVYEKGVTNGDRLIAMARAAELKDTKVAKISERFAALRFIAAKT